MRMDLKKSSGQYDIVKTLSGTAACATESRVASVAQIT